MIGRWLESTIVLAPITQGSSGGSILNRFGIELWAGLASRGCAIGLLFCVCLMFSFRRAFAANEAASERKPAKLDVTGYGFFGNRELKRLLRMLDAKEAKREFYDSNFIE